MKSNSTRVVGLIIVLTLMAITSNVLAKEGIWTIGPRMLPPSMDVSNEFREILLNTPTPNTEAAKSNIPETTEQWKAMIRAADEQTAAAARKMAQALSVKVQHDTIEGVNIYRVTPPEIAPEHKNHLFFHVHGGAYILNGGEAGTFEAVLIASHLKMPVISIDYRMPPKHPAPAAMEDVVAVWKVLLSEHSPALMAMGGHFRRGGSYYVVCATFPRT